MSDRPSEVSVSSRNQSYVIYLLLFVAIIAMVVYNFRQQNNASDVLTINEVASQIQSGKIERIVEDDNRLRVIYSDGTQKESHKESNGTLVDQLISLGVTPVQLSSDKVKI